MQFFWGVLILDAVLIVALLLWRQFMGMRRLRSTRFISQWRPVLMQYSMNVKPAQLPSLSARDHLVFLMLWTVIDEKFFGGHSMKLKIESQNHQVQKHERHQPRSF